MLLVNGGRMTGYEAVGFIANILNEEVKNEVIDINISVHGRLHDKDYSHYMIFIDAQKIIDFYLNKKTAIY